MTNRTPKQQKFKCTWEQRKLGDIGKARSGVGFPDAEQGGVTGIPFFKVSDMNFYYLLKYVIINFLCIIWTL